MLKADTAAFEIKKTQILKTDYFVVGSGATGLAFVGTLLIENKHCQIILVDRYNAPGVHWTLAYSFVRLHQPASSYGVNSKRLGKTHKMDPINLFSKDEILTYYEDVLSDFVKIGHVKYFPECNADIDAALFVSLSNNEIRYQVLVKKNSQYNIHEIYCSINETSTV